MMAGIAYPLMRQVAAKSGVFELVLSGPVSLPARRDSPISQPSRKRSHAIWLSVSMIAALSLNFIFNGFC